GDETSVAQWSPPERLWRLWREGQRPGVREFLGPLAAAEEQTRGLREGPTQVRVADLLWIWERWHGGFSLSSGATQATGGAVFSCRSARAAQSTRLFPSSFQRGKHSVVPSTLARDCSSRIVGAQARTPVDRPKPTRTRKPPLEVIPGKVSENGIVRLSDFVLFLCMTLEYLLLAGRDVVAANHPGV